MANGTRTAGDQGGERPKRLLVVVDGDNSHLFYTSMLLQRLDYNIHTTKSAEDALDMVDVANPALVVTGLSLPGTDGFELLKKIKRNPKTHSIPVVILTAKRDAAAREACMQEGCAAFLQKPVEPDALYAEIQKATESTPRKFIRLNTCLNVIVGDEKSASTVINDYITALSENGMFVSTSKPKPVGLQVPVTIFLDQMKIAAEGMVLYSFQRGEGPLKTPGMGIKFVRIRQEDQDIIRVFIKREITKGLTMGHIGGTIF